MSHAPAIGAAGAPAAASPAAVQLADAQRVLAMFAQGLSGRYLHLKQVKLEAGTFRPGAINTDGNSIHLPLLVDTFASTRENFAVYRIAVLHQLGYFENGTFAFTLDRLRAAMARESDAELPTRVPIAHLPLRGMQARDIADLERFIGMWPAPLLMRRLFVIFEDLRTDLAMRERYPGAAADLQRLLAHALEKRPPLEGLTPLSQLLESLLRFSLGAPARALLAAHPSRWLAAMLQAGARVQAANASVYDSALAAIACYRTIEQAARRGDGAGVASEAIDDFEEPPSDDSDESKPGAGGGDDPGTPDEANAAELDETATGLKAVDFRGELVPENVQRTVLAGGGGFLPEDTDAASDAEPPTEARDTPPPDKKQRPRARLTQRPPSLDAKPRSYLYDEWDYLHQTWLKGWCRVYEHRLRGEDFTFISTLRRRHALLAQQVKRRFRLIRPESWQRQHRVSDGEEIDLNGMIESVIDRRTGHSSDETVYVRRHRGLREVAAAFLLDMSASTDFPIPERATPPDTPKTAPARDPIEVDEPQYLYGGRFGVPEFKESPPRRRVIDVAKESLALMGDALHALGDSHALYGFSGDGREQVDFYVAKDFGDPPSARTWAALGEMKPKRSTRMGPAIRHALSKLKHQPMKRKVLIVVSDGYPQDHDYGPDRSDEEYGIQDTASALREAARAGVSTFCITIDPAGHDYLRRMCDAGSYLVIDDVEALPEELSKVYRGLTASMARARSSADADADRSSA